MWQEWLTGDVHGVFAGRHKVRRPLGRSRFNEYIA